MLLLSLGIEKGGTMTHRIVVRTVNFNENRYSDVCGPNKEHLSVCPSTCPSFDNVSFPVILVVMSNEH